MEEQNSSIYLNLCQDTKPWCAEDVKIDGKPVVLFNLKKDEVVNFSIGNGPFSQLNDTLYVSVHGNSDSSDAFTSSISSNSELYWKEDLIQFLEKVLGASNCRTIEPRIKVELLICGAYQNGFAHELMKALVEKGIFVDLIAHKGDSAEITWGRSSKEPPYEMIEGTNKNVPNLRFLLQPDGNEIDLGKAQYSQDLCNKMQERKFLALLESRSCFIPDEAFDRDKKFTHYEEKIIESSKMLVQEAHTLSYETNPNLRANRLLQAMANQLMIIYNLAKNDPEDQEILVKVAQKIEKHFDLEELKLFSFIEGETQIILKELQALKLGILGEILPNGFKDFDIKPEIQTQLIEKYQLMEQELNEINEVDSDIKASLVLKEITAYLIDIYKLANQQEEDGAKIFLKDFAEKLEEHLGFEAQHDRLKRYFPSIEANKESLNELEALKETLKTGYQSFLS